MGVEYDAALRHQQWGALPPALQASVRADHERLVAKRNALRVERTRRVMAGQMPCVLAPASPP